MTGRGSRSFFHSLARRLLLLVAGGTLLVGCTKKKSEFQDLTFSKIRLSEPIREAELPEALWKKIELMAPPPGALPPEKSDDKKEDKKEGKKEAAKEPKEKAEEKKPEEKKEASRPGSILVQAPDIPREPMSLRVQFIEKTHGVLNHQNLEFQLPKGGGELDLSRVTVPKFHGTYRLRIQYDLALDKDETMSVFFVPAARRRTLNDEIFGNGCSGYLDLTTFFKKIVANEGLDLNTTEQRDVSALSGTYFFIMPRGNLLFMAYLKIDDTQHPEVGCKRGEK